MTKVLKCDCSAGDAYVENTVTFPAEWWLEYQVAVPAATLAAIAAASSGFTAFFSNAPDGGGFTPDAIHLGDNSNPSSISPPPATIMAERGGSPLAAAFSADAWHTIKQHSDGATMEWYLDGTLIFSYAQAEPTGAGGLEMGGFLANDISGEIYYVRAVTLGTTDGGTEIFADDFSSGDTSAWSTATGAVSVIDDPVGGGGGGGGSSLTIKLYDLGATELADISGIALEKSFVRQLNGPRSFTVTAPAGSELLTAIAGDTYPNLRFGNRKLVVWENSDPDVDDPIFHGRIFTVERDGNENSVQVKITAYDPWMELGFDADNRAGRLVRDSSTTTFGDPSFLTPKFTPTPSQDGISGPDLIQQVLTYSQGDPTTNPLQGEGPLPIDIVSGEWDLDVPPALDVNPIDSADWPVLIGDFINQLVQSGAVDFDLRPIRPGTGKNVDGDLDDYVMVEASSKSKMGTDRSATVHFDYLTGSHNAKACKLVDDFSTLCQHLWYELGPRLNQKHWRADITPHSSGELGDASAAIYGGPDSPPGYFASVRVEDSIGTEASSRPLYTALYFDETGLRREPRRLLYITPADGDKALFDAPQNYDAYDVIQIKTGSGFGEALDEAQRVYGYTKTWSRENVSSVGQLLTSADYSVGGE